MASVAESGDKKEPVVRADCLMLTSRGQVEFAGKKYLIRVDQEQTADSYAVCATETLPGKIS